MMDLAAMTVNDTEVQIKGIEAQYIASARWVAGVRSG
jgi:hypothetical protein